MKKILILTLCLFLIGCSTPAEPSTGNTTEPVEEEIVMETEEKGAGSFYLENQSGTTEAGNPITIIDDGTTSLLQIGITTKEFDGSKITYVYVDNELLTKEQYAESQGVLNLEQKHLTEGIHQVVLKQYENDDESTEPVVIKFASYEVKSK